MSLPQEIKLEVVQYLGKKDLKAVRLVSRKWSVCTVAFLFNRLQWSPQDPDLEVFENIVHHEELAGCVQKLVFDGTQFDIGISRKQYLGILQRQIHELYGRQLADTPPLNNADSRINAFAHEIRHCERDDLDDQLEASWIVYGGCAFVREGYGRWVQCARTQQERMMDPSVFERFTSGLAKLSKHSSPLILVPPLREDNRNNFIRALDSYLLFSPWAFSEVDLHTDCRGNRELEDR